ncbi:MAG TPA: amino acid ABC transporter permease [Dehalococcoidales bacterium]|jgi:polar amino acid transport system permease protein|nr:amino acid ABC transporter permease [Dehalococcoidales bacterium]
MFSRRKSESPEFKVPELENVPEAGVGYHIDAWWWLVVLVAGLIAILSITKPDPYWRIVLFVRDGIGVTILITIVSFVLMIFVGMLGGLGRLSTNKLINLVTTLYVELVRGIPLLVQLIWWYFAFPVIVRELGQATHISFLANYEANAIFLAIFGFVFCYGAYMSEIFRAGIQSIPKGQMEAARSLGMSYFQAMRHVILPQAIRVILPPVGNEFIALLKDSSLVSAVALADLTRRGREFMAANFDPLQVWTMIALLYLVMTLFSARIVNYIERRTKIER